mmetsp:Transcript_37796/g.106804  ORF Transcript_37796/g.106804 Transcript_37796/m.106804 type:complete len:253 (-) Transcript_37796:288-1046(-)
MLCSSESEMSPPTPPRISTGSRLCSVAIVTTACASRGLHLVTLWASRQPRQRPPGQSRIHCVASLTGTHSDAVFSSASTCRRDAPPPPWLLHKQSIAAANWRSMQQQQQNAWKTKPAGADCKDRPQGGTCVGFRAGQTLEYSRWKSCGGPAARRDTCCGARRSSSWRPRRTDCSHVSLKCVCSPTMDQVPGQVIADSDLLRKRTAILSSSTNIHTPRWRRASLWALSMPTMELGFCEMLPSSDRSTVSIPGC